MSDDDRWIYEMILRFAMENGLTKKDATKRLIKKLKRLEGK